MAMETPKTPTGQVLSSAVRSDVKVTALYKMSRKTLGHGISGTVYKGTHRKTKKPVAIKAMRYKDAGGELVCCCAVVCMCGGVCVGCWCCVLWPNRLFVVVHVSILFCCCDVVLPTHSLRGRVILHTELERARAEIYILRKIAKLGNPGLMSALDAFEDKKKRIVYLVMPFCEGGELFRRIHKKGRLSEEQASAIFRKLVLAIADLHNHGILHCDLKCGASFFLLFFFLSLIPPQAVVWRRALSHPSSSCPWVCVQKTSC
mgnify:CR=1 FL=1